MIYLCKIVGQPFLKVGYSENFQTRLAILQASMPFEIEVIAERNGSRLLEKAVHEACSKHAVKNEWYHYEEAVIEAFFKCYDPEPECKTSKDISAKRRKEKTEAKIIFQGGVPTVHGARIRYINPRTGVWA